MGRYRRNSDADLVEGIAALVGLVFLLAMFSPKLMQQITSICILVGVIGFFLIVAFVAFKIYRSRRRGADPTIPSRVTIFQTLHTSVPELQPHTPPTPSVEPPQGAVQAHHPGGPPCHRLVPA